MTFKCNVGQFFVFKISTVKIEFILINFVEVTESYEQYEFLSER